jgi:hypothetical protein
MPRVPHSQAKTRGPLRMARRKLRWGRSMLLATTANMGSKGKRSDRADKFEQSADCDQPPRGYADLHARNRAAALL